MKAYIYYVGGLSTDEKGVCYDALLDLLISWYGVRATPKKPRKHYVCNIPTYWVFYVDEVHLSYGSGVTVSSWEECKHNTTARNFFKYEVVHINMNHLLTECEVDMYHGL